MERRLFVTRAVGLAAFVFGLTSAAAKSWLCDDAFISFRYAWNLVHGNGLVFNEGERVEGYTNFLWTLWCAIPLALGRDVEPFAIGSGLVLFAGLLALLFQEHRSAAVPGLLPIALASAALMPDLAVFATCGLETCLVAVLALAGYAALARRRRALAGLILGAATLARPDSALFVVSGFLFVIWEDRLMPSGKAPWERLRGALALALCAAAWVVPHVVFRYLYYGDLVPNTYYAKSANLSWWSQGLTYVALVFARYWPLLSGPVLAGVLLVRAHRAGAVNDEESRSDLRRLVLALVLAMPYVVYVAKVGGDFMFARLLVPVMPLLLVALERSLALVAREGARESDGESKRGELGIGGVASAVVLLGLLLTPSPVGTDLAGHGIVDEWRFYHVTRPGWAEGSRRDGAVLARFFEGLPVRVAFFGAQARLMYYARPAVAIESAAGLTDAFIAKQALRVRGRVGHEKAAPPGYLLETRKVHLTFDPLAGQIARLDGAIPFVPIDLGGVQGRIVTWDPALMAELAKRGARFPDVPRLLDEYLANAVRLPTERLAADLVRFERFYLGPAGDEVRRKRFRALLEQAGRGPAAPGTRAAS